MITFITSIVSLISCIHFVLLQINPSSADSCCSLEDLSYFFHLDGPINPSTGNLVGNVSIGETLYVEFNFIINELHDTSIPWYPNILVIGQESGLWPRLPGFWLYPSDTKLHIIMSDEQNEQRSYDTTFELDLNTLYNVKFTVCNGIVTSYLNDNIIVQNTDINIITTQDEDIWICSRFSRPALVTITDLTISSCMYMHACVLCLQCVCTCVVASSTIYCTHQ